MPFGHAHKLLKSETMSLTHAVSYYIYRMKAMDSTQEMAQLTLMGTLSLSRKLETGKHALSYWVLFIILHATWMIKYPIVFLTFILPHTGTECCERLAYYGIATNLVTYLTKKLHEGNVSAARNVTTWSGTCYLTPLIGAVLADTCWGRYWTIAAFSAIYFIVIVNRTH